MNSDADISFKGYLKDQALKTLDFFTGLDEITKQLVAEKLSQHHFKGRPSKEYKAELYSLFEGKNFEWIELTYFRKWLEKNNQSVTMINSFCKNGTPKQIVDLLMFTVRDRACDAHRKDQLISMGYKKSDLLVTYENELAILKRLKRLKTLPWKYPIHPIAPGLSVDRVAYFDDEPSEYVEDLF